ARTLLARIPEEGGREGGKEGEEEGEGWGRASSRSKRSVSHARAPRWYRAAGFPDDGIRELKQRGSLPARDGCTKLQWRISKKLGDRSSGRSKPPFPTSGKTEMGARAGREEETLKPLGTHLSIATNRNGRKGGRAS
ncbi:hypothetical protein U0070_008995, partial [Myodes glareolus]